MYLEKIYYYSKGILTIMNTIVHYKALGEETVWLYYYNEPVYAEYTQYQDNSVHRQWKYYSASEQKQ